MHTSSVCAASFALIAFVAACNDGSQVTAGAAGAAATGNAPSASGAAGTPVVPVPGGGAPATGGAGNATGGSGVTEGGSSPTAGTDAGGALTAGGMATVGGGSSGGGSAGGGTVSMGDPYSGPFKILVLSKTLGFHHDSIPACQQMLRELGQCADAASCTAAGQGDAPITGAKPNSTFTVDVAGAPATGCPAIQSKPANASASGYAAYNSMGCDGSNTDLSQFNATNLDTKQFSSPTAAKGPYQMVFFCGPTGTDFTSGGANGSAGMTAIQNFVSAGAGYGGVHSASDFENSEAWAWYYNSLMGSWFKDHNGDGTSGTVNTAPMFAMHPVMRGIPNPWNTQDEWYYQNREMSSVPGFQILATLSGVPAVAGEPANDIRPIIWIKQFPVAADATKTFEGRMFNTVRGHNIARYGEAPFRQLIHQGVLWAANRLN